MVSETLHLWSTKHDCVGLLFVSSLCFFRRRRRRRDRSIYLFFVYHMLVCTCTRSASPIIYGLMNGFDTLLCMVRRCYKSLFYSDSSCLHCRALPIHIKFEMCIFSCCKSVDRPLTILETNNLLLLFLFFRQRLCGFVITTWHAILAFSLSKSCSLFVLCVCVCVVSNETTFPHCTTRKV